MNFELLLQENVDGTIRRDHTFFSTPIEKHVYSFAVFKLGR